MVLHALDLVHEHSCMSSPRSFFGFGDWAAVTDTTGGALYEAAQCVEEEERSWYQHYYSDNCNGEQIPEIRRRTNGGDWEAWEFNGEGAAPLGEAVREPARRGEGAARRGGAAVIS